MFLRMIRNNLRRPLYSLAVILFAMALTVVLCHLHKSAEEELERFETAYASVPVTFRVTDLDGSKVNNGILGWIVDLFDVSGIEPNLAPYVGQLHVRVSKGGTCSYRYTTDEGETFDSVNYHDLAGISSLYVAQELTENWGGQVIWYDGYDESILSSEEEVCLVPESMKETQELFAEFYYVEYVNGETIRKTAELTLKVVGYYVDPGNQRVYCPFAVMSRVHAKLGISKAIEELCCILNDNNELAGLKETAALWFAEPNAAGEKTPWDRFGYDYYPYALHIEDTMLHTLEADMKSSIRLNEIISAVVFALSAGAGFLTGFLIIRSRKREISLMRTIGVSHAAIFTELAVEQVICITVGIALGGSYSLWQPLDRLAIFSAIYFAGLVVALTIFLRKNLLATMKEDE